jgi:hypothetical protein
LFWVIVFVALLGFDRGVDRAEACDAGSYEPSGDPQRLAEEIAPAVRQASGCSSVEKIVSGISSWYFNKVVKESNGKSLHMPPSGRPMDQKTIAFAARAETADLFQIICVSRMDREGHSVGEPICGPVLDRGPFVPGRVLDAWPAAANALGLKKLGEAPVKIEVCSSYVRKK